VEQFAPWVRKIHFVTCGQKPEWLNADHPKLSLVNHSDYIPQQFLPTFNSSLIEIYLHRIPDLTEHFVYFNDDFLSSTTSRRNDSSRTDYQMTSLLSVSIWVWDYGRNV